MADRDNPGQIGEQIERLLDEVRGAATPPAWRRVEELIRLILELYGSGLTRILEIAADAPLSGAALIGRLAQDELISSLLILHGLHPDDFAARVRKALERVRPYLGSHGGNVELVEVDDASGAVRLRMEGSCEACPSSTLTVKLAVEGAIRELAPEAGSVEVEGIQAPPVANGAGVHAPKWSRLDHPPALAAGDLARIEFNGAPIALCRVARSLYAYRDLCPGCAAPIHAASLQESILTCGSCGRRFDVRRAGQCLDGNGLHLDPVPLLEDGAGVKIALAQA